MCRVRKGQHRQNLRGWERRGPTRREGTLRGVTGQELVELSIGLRPEHTHCGPGHCPPGQRLCSAKGWDPGSTGEPGRTHSWSGTRLSGCKQRPPLLAGTLRSLRQASWDVLEPDVGKSTEMDLCVATIFQVRNETTAEGNRVSLSTAGGRGSGPFELSP